MRGSYAAGPDVTFTSWSTSFKLRLLRPNDSCIMGGVGGWVGGGRVSGLRMPACVWWYWNWLVQDRVPGAPRRCYAPRAHCAGSRRQSWCTTGGARGHCCNLAPVHARRCVGICSLSHSGTVWPLRPVGTYQLPTRPNRLLRLLTLSSIANFTLIQLPYATQPPPSTHPYHFPSIHTSGPAQLHPPQPLFSAFLGKNLPLLAALSSLH